jgi:hypothetical protein
MKFWQSQNFIEKIHLPPYDFKRGEAALLQLTPTSNCAGFMYHKKVSLKKAVGSIYRLPFLYYSA